MKQETVVPKNEPEVKMEVDGTDESDDDPVTSEVGLIL